jgi:hypothetical protein
LTELQEQNRPEWYPCNTVSGGSNEYEGIGFLAGEGPWIAAFRDELRRLGYVD